MLRTALRLLRYRSLLATLTARELAARYRGSLLGYLWSLVNPLLLLGVFSFVFVFVFRRPFSDTEPYALFLISGLFPWVWFSSSVLEGTTSLGANAGLIRKAVFPVEVLPVVSVLANLVHLLLALPIIGVALLVGRMFGYQVGGWTLLLIPLVILLQLPMICGLALGLAVLNVHFKDVRDLLGNLLQLLFFLTPIIYSLDAIGPRLVRALIRLNPITPYTLAYQRLIFHGALPEPVDVAGMVALSLAFWGVGGMLFERLRDTVAEAV